MEARASPVTRISSLNFLGSKTLESKATRLLFLNVLEARGFVDNSRTTVFLSHKVEGHKILGLEIETLDLEINGGESGR